MRWYACGRFGHIDNQYRSRENQGNLRPNQRNNIVFYACNKSDQIAKFCRSKNINKNASVDNNKSNDKGKVKVEEIRE